MPFIVELEPGVWLAEVIGDPGRALVLENAMRYTNESRASKALAWARVQRPGKFRDAKIEEVV